MFILVSCFKLVCFSKLVSGGNIKAPLLEINVPRIVSRVLPPMKDNQASIPEKSQIPRVSTYRSFVKPGRGAQKGS